MVDKISTIPNGVLKISGGFSQGLNHSDYYDIMGRSKVVLCPRGNVSPDSFRIYEALECGCIPIAENTAFWRLMFGNVPFPVIDEPNQWKIYADYAIKHFYGKQWAISDWWKEQKEKIKKELRR
jgi:hypothetical protein